VTLVACRICGLVQRVGALAPGAQAVCPRCGAVVVEHKVKLSRDATAAHTHVFIGQRYARLVCVGSRFWSASGFDVTISLRKGVEISLESLRSLVVGGIAFATPEDPRSPPAKDGTIFVLHDKPEKEWLSWMPKIPIPAATD